MNTPLDPVTLRALVEIFDGRRDEESAHLRDKCICKVPMVHAARVGLYAGIAAELLTWAMQTEIESRKAAKRG